MLWLDLQITLQNLANMLIYIYICLLQSATLKLIKSVSE